MPEVPARGPDWRVVAQSSTAWFETSSLRDGARLAQRVIAASPDSAVDVRSSGVRVRLGSTTTADAISQAARELGLAASPELLQQVGVVVDSPDPGPVAEFWHGVLGYEPEDGGLVDPLRRDPPLLIRPSDDMRPLRNRIHLDVVRPAATVAGLGLGDGSGPYGVCHADPDGNEVDLVPADRLGDTEATADWHAVFGAVTCYRTTTAMQQIYLVAAAADLADEAGFPLLIDVRPGLVVLDTGKDLWEADVHGLDVDFVELAAHLQAAARERGAAAEPALLRFVQVFLDAADVAAVRDFWRAALGYADDPRAGVTDLVDPRRLDPVFVFQELDRADTARRQQRNRIHVELTVPSATAPDRLATALAAGGRLLDEASTEWRIADPEGNELVIAHT